MISLKWKIQAWHTAILALVLAVLGVGFYFNEREHRLTELDFTLDQQIHPLVQNSKVLRGLVPPPGERKDIRRQSPSDLPDPPGGWVIDRDSFAPGHVPRSREEGIRGRRSPFEAVERHFANLGFYCILWDTHTGELIYRSEHAPEMEPPLVFDDGYMRRIRDGRYREVFHSNPSARIVVGIDLSSVYAELHQLKWQIAGVLSAIFLLCLGIGYALVAHSIAPLKVIQEAADAIAKGKLKDRIPPETGGNTTELVHLTEDLNETFTHLEDLFQRQIRFTADASHELRTPLTALVGHLKLGLNRKRSVEEHEDILQTCERAATRIQRITDDLLELSRYDSGSFQLDQEPMALDQLLACLAEDLQPVLSQHGSTLETDLQKVKVLCDPFRIEQVVTNLINNALQHNPEPIVITLRTRVEADGARIEVADNGKGIQPENLDKLFDRFFQESASRSKRGRHLNVGLGLAISQAIVQAHGGTIQARSQPGVETVFEIRLPA